MRFRIAIFALTLVLGVAAFASAQTAVQPGTVVRIDPQSSVVALDDGRMFRITPNTVLMIDNRPAALTALRPGDRVVVQAGEPVIYREGRYFVVQPAPAVVAQAPAPAVVQAPPPPPVIVQTPPPAPAVAVPVGVRQTMYGVITDVDRDGKVKIKTNRDSFETRISPEALRHVKKGDNVVIDLTISPPGAASPR
jgi:preprotein translocase subunit YajC